MAGAAALPALPMCTALNCPAKIGTFLLGTGFRLSCSSAFDSAGREIPKRAALLAGASNSAPLLCRLLWLLSWRSKKSTFLHRKAFYALKKFHSPCGLWRNKLCKSKRKNFSPQLLTEPVENFFFPHIRLWIKKRCGSKTKPTYPHKFVLILLRLPIPMIDISIFLN